MLIIITGTPGTGKTEISNELANITGLEALHLTDLINQKKLYSMISKEKVVDIKKLEDALKLVLKIKRNLIIEGHLACETKLPADFVFVLRTHPKILAKRLAKRGYNKRKITENLLAEMLDYCTIRSEQNYKKKVLELDTTKRGRRESVRSMFNAIKRKSKKIDNVNYRNELIKYTKSATRNGRSYE